jgi:hypothetical protein
MKTIHARSLPWVALSVLAFTAPHAQTGGRLQDAASGISVVKPLDWVIAKQQAGAIKVASRLTDEDLAKAVGNAPAIPLFIFTRYPEAHPDPNPSIQVVLRPLGDDAGKTAVELMQETVDPMKGAFKDFRFVSDIKATTVGGLPASSMKAAYTILTQDGRKLPTQTDFWIVPRGKFMFVIGAAGPQEGPDAYDAEFDRFVSSVQIQP